jgi:hypothetical protein
VKNRALLSAVALCFVVAGCESKKEAPAQPKVADKVVPLPAAAPTPPPASGNQDASPGKAGQVAPPPPYPPGCTQGNCKVWMDVTGTEDPNCSIRKQPNPLYVYKGNQNDTISFMLRTTDWEFQPDGIVFSTGGITCTRDANPKKFSCLNPNTTPGVSTHNYSVKVKNTRTNKGCTQDPSVVNGVDDAQTAAMTEPAI